MRRITYLGLLMLALAFSSCSADVKIEDYIDMSAPLMLTINTTNPETGLTEGKSESLDINSDKWQKLMVWGNSNREGWTSTPASHIGDVYVVQGDFRLIHKRETTAVVIAFTDMDGNPRQYINVIEEGELSFLYESP